MDNFLKLPDEKTKKQTRKNKISPSSRVSAERIEKLKKTFQPFWMRGMMLHRKEPGEPHHSMSSWHYI